MLENERRGTKWQDRSVNTVKPTTALWSSTIGVESSIKEGGRPSWPKGWSSGLWGIRLAKNSLETIINSRVVAEGVTTHLPQDVSPCWDLFFLLYIFSLPTIPSLNISSIVFKNPQNT